MSLGLDGALAGRRPPIEDEARALAAYAEREGFPWRFAVAVPRVVESLRVAWGQRLVEPSAEPMVLVDAQGEPFAAPGGRKDALALRQLVQIARP